MTLHTQSAIIQIDLTYLVLTVGYNKNRDLRNKVSVVILLQSEILEIHLMFPIAQVLSSELGKC